MTGPDARIQHLVVDGSPEAVRAVHAEMSARLRRLLATEGCGYHPQAVRLLRRAAVALEIDSRATRPPAPFVTWLKLRHWARVWFSTAGAGMIVPWHERSGRLQ